jgi:phosphoglucosamine mutase
MPRFPQVLINVRVTQRFDPLGVPAVVKVVGEVERHFAGEGRVVLRASGTEPVIRVMVEAREEQVARTAAERIAAAVKAASP